MKQEKSFETRYVLFMYFIYFFIILYVKHMRKHLFVCCWKPFPFQWQILLQDMRISNALVHKYTCAQNM